MNRTWLSKLAFAGFGALTVCSLAHAAGVPGQGTWETTLQGRDLDGDQSNGFEAYYDTTQNLTWLADANLAATSGVSEAGLMLGYNPFFGPAGAPNTAVGFAFAANLYGIDDWQLPSLSLGNEIYQVVCEPGRTTCDNIPTGRYEVVPGSSQLQQLMDVTLGNRSSSNDSYSLENTGPFKNVQSGPYWSSKFMATTYSFSGWQYDAASGQHVQLPYSGSGYAWLVRVGDVAAVPEPQSVVMWAFGLLALMGAVSRRKAANFGQHHIQSGVDHA
jgi:hypothetical protein